MEDKNNKIQLFENRQIRALWDENTEKWWFSILDIIAVLTDQQDYKKVRNYWKWLKNKLKEEGSNLFANQQNNEDFSDTNILKIETELVSKTNQLKMLAADGKYYKTDVADTEQVLRIIQSIPSKKAEPFKMWLAQIGRERLEEIDDPELGIEKPLVDKEYLLEKFPCKGGWTFTEIPEILPDKNAPFSWVKVKGSIDGYEINKYHLMPSGKGTLLLFVKTDIRKKIKKQAGDNVHIILYPDNEPLEVPEEFLLCLQDDNEALQFFNSLKESEQHNYIKWIYSAKTEQTKEDRMAKTINKLIKHQKFTDK